MHIQHWLKIGTSLSVWLMAAPVLAQNAAPAPADAKPAVDQSGIQEIIVTAQRREESLQKVPIAVSVLTSQAAAMRGITDTSLLQTSIPGLDFSRQVNAATPFLRGVGTSNGTVGNEPSVAMYVDNVYLTAGQATLFSFNNIDRVEVLKGPQGTLFGRNATGGVINVITLDPSQQTVIKGNAGFSNYKTYDGAFYASGGLSDSVSANIAAYGRKQNDGWGHNLTTGEEVYKGYDWGVRGKIKWEPGDRTSVILAADYNKSLFEEGINLIIQPGAVGVGGITFKGHYSPQGGSVDSSLVQQGGGSLKIHQDMDFASLVSITAYRRYRTLFTLDQDAGPQNFLLLDPFRQRGDTFTQEMQLLSPQGSPLTWIVGGYYFNDVSAYDPQVALSATTAALNRVSFSTQKTHSLSGYGQATYEVLPDTDITAGLRYTSDTRHIIAHRESFAGALLPGTTANAQATFNKLTYRFSIDHHFGSNVTAYASYNRGFKSGIYNVANPTAAPVRPEVLDAIEVGIKSDLLDRRLRLNLSGFDYRFKNIQLTQIVLGTSNLFNAARAHIYGGEIEFTALPSPNFKVSGGVSYLHGVYTDFPGGPLNIPNPAVCDSNPAVPGNQPAQTGPATGGNLQCAVNLTGNKTVHTPSVTVSLAVDWRIPTSFGNIDANTSLYTNSGFYWESDNGNEQKAYELVNASLQWTEPHEHYYVRGWAKNIFNTYYTSYAASTTFGKTESPSPPRTYGVTVGFAL